MRVFLSTGFIGKGGLLWLSSSRELTNTKTSHILVLFEVLISFKIHSSNILLVVSDWFDMKLYPTDTSGRGFKCGFHTPKQPIFSVRMM